MTARTDKTVQQAAGPAAGVSKDGARPVKIRRRASDGGRRRPLPAALSLHALALILVALVLVPLLFAIIGGFKDTTQLSDNAFGLPDPWRPENYTDVLTAGDFWRQLFNSTLVALGTTVIVVIAGAMVAFVMARFSFRGREGFFTLFTVGLMFPPAVAILPLFVLLREMSLLDNPFGVILPQAAFGLPITIIILRGFFREVPHEVEEAAILDGCSPAGFFWRILMPMSRPALATVAVLSLVVSWNNYFLPLVVFTDPDWWTLPLGVQQFQGQYASDTAKVLAYLVLAMLPALGFFAIAERHLASGLTAGATKG